MARHHHFVSRLAGLLLRASLLMLLPFAAARADVAGTATISPAYAFGFNGGNANASFIDNVVQAHNRYRSEIGMPGLQWSEQLSRAAQAWAETLARENRFDHSQRSADEEVYGENLAMTTGDEPPGGMVDFWGVEKRDFVTGVLFPNNSRTGDWTAVGHYTQVVWHSTKEVGCGVARAHGKTIMVCRYLPAGNWVGESPY